MYTEEDYEIDKDLNEKAHKALTIINEECDRLNDDYNICAIGSYKSDEQKIKGVLFELMPKENFKLLLETVLEVTTKSMEEYNNLRKKR